MTTSPNPDRDTVDLVEGVERWRSHPSNVIAALTFGLHSLCAQKPGGHFQTVGFFTDPDELFERSATLTADGFNVWRGVNPLNHSPKTGRGGAVDVAGVHAVYADIDWLDDTAHKDAHLPTETEVRERLAPLLDRLSVVVNSGHGLQIYALLDRPVDLDTGETASSEIRRNPRRRRTSERPTGPGVRPPSSRLDQLQVRPD